MPRVNIYIRNEDWSAWQTIDDKPLLIHNALNNLAISASDRLVGSELDEGTQEVIRAINEPIITDKNKDMDFCKHNAVRGLCKKGCK